MVSSLESAAGVPSFGCYTAGKVIGVVGYWRVLLIWVFLAMVCYKLHRLLSRDLGAYMNHMATGSR